MKQKERVIFQGNEFYEIDIECENRKKEQCEYKKRQKEERKMRKNQTKK